MSVWPAYKLPDTSGPFLFPGGAAAAFSPADLSGLAVWLTAGPEYCFTDEAGTTPCGSGDAIKCWRNRDGLAIDFTQANAPSTQRRLVQDAGGKWYVETGGGANDYLICASPGEATGPAGVCCGGAFRPGVQGSTLFGPVGFGDSSSNGVFAFLRGNGDNPPKWQALVSGNGNSTTTTDTVAYTAGTDVRYTMRADPVTLDTVRLLKNGTQVASTARAVGLYSTAAASWAVGTDPGNLGRLYVGRIYGVVAYRVDLSDADATLLDTYLTSLMPE
jgi:hypothetical protein